MHITMAEANTPEEKANQKRILEMISKANMFIHACKEALLYGLPFPDPNATENLRTQLPVLVAVVTKADVPNRNGDVFPRTALEYFPETPSMTKHVDAAAVDSIPNADPEILQKLGWEITGIHSNVEDLQESLLKVIHLLEKNSAHPGKLHNWGELEAARDLVGKKVETGHPNSRVTTVPKLSRETSALRHDALRHVSGVLRARLDDAYDRVSAVTPSGEYKSPRGEREYDTEIADIYLKLLKSLGVDSGQSATTQVEALKTLLTSEKSS